MIRTCLLELRFHNRDHQQATNVSSDIGGKDVRKCTADCVHVQEAVVATSQYNLMAHCRTVIVDGLVQGCCVLLEQAIFEPCHPRNGNDVRVNEYMYVVGVVAPGQELASNELITGDSRSAVQPKPVASSGSGVCELPDCAVNK